MSEAMIELKPGDDGSVGVVDAARFPCACGCGRVATDVVDGFANEPGMDDLKGAPFSADCFMDIQKSIGTADAVEELGRRIRAHQERLRTTPGSFIDMAKTLHEMVISADPSQVDERGALMGSIALKMGRATGLGQDTKERITDVISSCIAQLELTNQSGDPAGAAAAIERARERIRALRTKQWIDRAQRETTNG